MDEQTGERKEEKRLKEAGSTPGQAGNTVPKVGQVYIMQLGSSVMARTCNAVGMYYRPRILKTEHAD